MDKKFKIGSARRIITPTIGTLLYGYTNERPASKINDDLTVNAIAFEQNGVFGITISADICIVSKEIADNIRNLVSKETSVPFENICFSCIHTHSGPAVMGYSGWGDSNEEYVNGILIPKTVEASKDAVNNMVYAVMGAGTTESLVGVNRRQILEDGSVDLGQNPFGVCDKTMTVVAFKDLSGKNILNIVHYGCHGTAAGHATEITRDWPGVMVDRLELQTGAMTVFFNGSLGDVGPRLSNGCTRSYDETIRYVNEIGELSAIDAVRSFKSIKEYREVKFDIIKGTIKLPYKAVPTLEEAKERLKYLESLEKLVEVQIRDHAILKETIKMHEENAKFDEVMEIEQTMYALNSTVFVSFPFELFSEIALRLRKYSPFENTLCTCNTNESKAYLPTKGDLMMGGYEVELFLYGSVHKLKDNTDDTIIQETLRIMREHLNK